MRWVYDARYDQLAPRANITEDYKAKDTASGTCMPIVPADDEDCSE